ncbi:hypothetical protein KP509_31G071100 [Ceratopteris richardii]|uniref:Uncharacterized protein n=1 Tax=Ceratopteris richardii TaxID=49495 RepID=A0A8T2R0V8_CERRI|nr:hypothetical protein KP509_31G071100 [Ceratopteris richardii]
MALLQASRSICCTHKPHPVTSARRSSDVVQVQFSSTFSSHAPRGVPPLSLRFGSSFFNESSLLKVKNEIAGVRSRIGNSGKGGACATVSSITLSAETLRWVFTCAAAAALFLKEASVTKSIIVPLLALQAPRCVVTAIRGEYGMWAAFLAILVKLFYQIPGELQLPLAFVLLLITAPAQVLDFRGTTAALITAACVAAYLAYEHFSKGDVKDCFKGISIFASIAVIVLIAVPLTIFFGGY